MKYHQQFEKSTVATCFDGRLSPTDGETITTQYGEEMERYVECEVCGQTYTGEVAIRSYTTETIIGSDKTEEVITHCKSCEPKEKR